MVRLPDGYERLQAATWAGRDFFLARDCNTRETVYLFAQPAEASGDVTTHPSLPPLRPIGDCAGHQWAVGYPPDGASLVELCHQGTLSEADVAGLLLSVIETLSYLADLYPPMVPGELEPTYITQNETGGWKFNLYGMALTPNIRRQHGGPPGVWAVGALLYWLITEQQPGAAPRAEVLEVLPEPYRTIIQRSLVDKCLSLRELYQELESIQEQEELRKRSEGTGRRLQFFHRPSRAHLAPPSVACARRPALDRQAAPCIPPQPYAGAPETVAAQAGESGSGGEMGVEARARPAGREEPDARGEAGAAGKGQAGVRALPWRINGSVGTVGAFVGMFLVLWIANTWWAGYAARHRAIADKSDPPTAASAPLVGKQAPANGSRSQPAVTEAADESAAEEQAPEEQEAPPPAAPEEEPARHTAASRPASPAVTFRLLGKTIGHASSVRNIAGSPAIPASEFGLVFTEHAAQQLPDGTLKIRIAAGNEVIGTPVLEGGQQWLRLTPQFLADLKFELVSWDGGFVDLKPLF